MGGGPGITAVISQGGSNHVPESRTGLRDERRLNMHCLVLQCMVPFVLLLLSASSSRMCNRSGWND